MAGKSSFEDMHKVRDTLTDCKAELEHMDSPFLLQEVHKTEEEVLLLSDFLQLQLQHLMKRTEHVEKEQNRYTVNKSSAR